MRRSNSNQLASCIDSHGIVWQEVFFNPVGVPSLPHGPVFLCTQLMLHAMNTQCQVQSSVSISVHGPPLTNAKAVWPPTQVYRQARPSIYLEAHDCQIDPRRYLLLHRYRLCMTLLRYEYPASDKASAAHMATSFRTNTSESMLQSRNIIMIILTAPPSQICLFKPGIIINRILQAKAYIQSI